MNVQSQHRAMLPVTLTIDASAEGSPVLREHASRTPTTKLLREKQKEATQGFTGMLCPNCLRIHIGFKNAYRGTSYEVRPNGTYKPSQVTPRALKTVMRHCQGKGYQATRPWVPEPLSWGTSAQHQEEPEYIIYTYIYMMIIQI